MVDNDTVGIKLSNFTNAVKDSLKQENWYSALTLVLTLPDICGKLENPTQSSTKRYINWFDKYLGKEYSLEICGEILIFLSGRDVYALRCSYLHGGEGNISSQRIMELLDEFVFIVPKFIDGEYKGSHCNKINNKLQLRVDLFCIDICNAVDEWVNNNGGNKRIQEATNKMLEIHMNGVTLYGGGIRIE
jgi:hypothetical protein